MIISHKRKFIFFVCGKTGTHSIEKTLLQNDDGHDLGKVIVIELAKLGKRPDGRSHNPKHVRPLLVKQILGQCQWDQYFKITFVRNPWDWVISKYQYNYKKQLASGGLV